MQVEFIFSGPSSGLSPLETEREAVCFVCSAIKHKAVDSCFHICLDSQVLVKDILVVKADLPHKSTINWDLSNWFFLSSKVEFKWIKREWIE